MQGTTSHLCSGVAGICFVDMLGIKLYEERAKRKRQGGSLTSFQRSRTLFYMALHANVFHMYLCGCGAGRANTMFLTDLTANNGGKIEWATMMIVAKQWSGMVIPPQIEALDLENLGKNGLNHRLS